MRFLSTAIVGLSKLANGIAILANACGTLIVLALVCVVNYDVIMRGVFNAPFMGTVEVVQFSLVMIVFLQLPDVVRANRLTRSDGFLLVMGNRAPNFARRLNNVIFIVSAIFMALIARAIWPEFVEMWHSQDYFGVPGVFTAPWWPIQLVIFLSACLCSIIFALKPFTEANASSTAKYAIEDDQ